MAGINPAATEKGVEQRVDTGFRSGVARLRRWKQDHDGGDKPRRYREGAERRVDNGFP